MKRATLTLRSVQPAHSPRGACSWDTTFASLSFDNWLAVHRPTPSFWMYFYFRKEIKDHLSNLNVDSEMVHSSLFWMTLNCKCCLTIAVFLSSMKTIKGLRANFFSSYGVFIWVQTTRFLSVWVTFNKVCVDGRDFIEECTARALQGPDTCSRFILRRCTCAKFNSMKWSHPVDFARGSGCPHLFRSYNYSLLFIYTQQVADKYWRACRYC